MPRPRSTANAGAAGPKATAPGGAQSVDRALQLLSLVGRGGVAGRGLAGLVADTGLSRPTARRLLMALMSARMVEQDDATRRYHLGPEAFLLGAFAASRHGLLTHAADSLRRLAQATGDTAFVSVPQGDYFLCLHREEGSFPIRTHALQSGDRNPLGAGAGGLALLAAMPAADAAAALRRLDTALSARLGGSAAVLAEDVALARARGYAVNPGRVVAGSWGIGHAILWPDGRPAGALSIAAIESRLQPERQHWIAGLLADEASRIEASLVARFGEDFDALDGATDAAAQGASRIA